MSARIVLTGGGFSGYRVARYAGPPALILSALTLSNSTINENLPAGTIIGAIQGITLGSLLSLIDSGGAKVAISGGNLIVGASNTDYDTVGASFPITIRETLAGAVGSPLDTVLTIAVTNILEVTLVALGGTFTLAEDAALNAVAGAVTGKSAGSVLTLLDNAGGRVALSGTNIVRGATALNFEGAASHSFTIRETHADGTNSPRDTVRTLTVTNVFEQPSLVALTGALSVVENAANTTVVGTPTGYTSGSVKSLSDNAGGRFAINASTGQITVANSSLLNWEAATSHNITIVETLADSANSPRSTTISIAVTNAFEQPNLAALTFSSASFTFGVTSSGTIGGATTGSAIAATGLPTGLTIDGAARTWNYNGGGSISSGSFTLTETLADSSNSPRPTIISYAIVASPMTAPALTFIAGRVAGTNPPEWNSDFTNYQVWDPATSNGDKHLMRWRRVSGGAWTTEAEQPLDDELLTGGFTWPMWEAAKPLGGGYLEVQEQRARYSGGVEISRSPMSNALTDTLDAPPAALSPPAGSVLWNEAQDLTTLFQNSDGTGAVAVAGNPIGYKGDKSGNGFHCTAAADSARASLAIVTSKKFIHYDGSATFLRRLSSLGLYSAGHAIIGFAGRGSPAASRCFFGVGGQSSNNPEYLPLMSDSGTPNRLGSQIRNNAGVVQIGNNTNLGVVWDGLFKRVIWVDNGSSLTVYVDGVQTAQSPDSYTRAPPVTLDITGFGALPRGIPTSFFQADEAAFVAYTTPSAPDATFIADLDAYLASTLP